MRKTIVLGAKVVVEKKIEISCHPARIVVPGPVTGPVQVVVDDTGWFCRNCKSYACANSYRCLRNALQASCVLCR